MFAKHRLAAVMGAVAGAFGAVVIAAHAALGAAGIMTAAQWQSGVMIGLVLLVAGGLRLVTAR